jgi:mannan endo-1,4-beta-mannosidase
VSFEYRIFIFIFFNNKGKYLSGQFAGVSGDNFNLTQVNAIENLTGHVPSILGCDYSDGWGQAIPPQKLLNYSCNDRLKDHWNKHGLIEINNHFSNPVSPNGGCLKNRSTLVFTDLLKPETETGQRWRSYIDIVAEGLNDLQQANVTVLYRPFHEMNGGWFWWGQQVSIFK